MAAELWLRLLGAVALALVGWAVSGVFGDRLLLGVALGAVLGFFITPYVTSRPIKRAVDKIPASTLIISAGGLVTGLVVAALISLPLSNLPSWPGIGIPLALSLLFGFLGVITALSKDKELAFFFPNGRRSSRGRPPGEEQALLDTSAIIDGRIADIVKSGFIRSVLLIPKFVLDELQHIADSSDPLRRHRGRRGLEILNELRKESEAQIQILDMDVRNGMEVDARLVRLAKNLKAPIITTDYNLNRVAELQGVRVLNVNELAQALKPVVLPGEEMAIRVVQEGERADQGVGFMEDGTMVVVEGGRRYMNQSLEVVVVRVLQTAAGRIIFAHPKGT